MDEAPSPTPVEALPYPHKTLFILGSIFTVLMLLVAAGIPYFENSSSEVAQNNSLPNCNYEFVFVNSSHEVIFPLCVKDSKVYDWGDFIEADPDTFVVTNWYGKDAHHVYFIGQDGEHYGPDLLVGADPATFEVSSTTNSFDAQDKNQKYLRGQIVRTTAQNNVVISNYKAVTDEYGTSSTIDLTFSLAPFSKRTMKFTVGALETQQNKLSDYTFKFEQKDSYAVLSDAGHELLWFMPLNENLADASVEEAVYDLEFIYQTNNDPTFNKEEFKKFCPIIKGTTNGKTYYGFGDPSNSDKAVIEEKYGKHSSDFYCDTFAIFSVFDNVLVVDRAAPVDAMEVKGSIRDITLIN
jgi:hypothetical protein